MKVILLQNIPKIGKMDEIKEVSNGYARNFLFVKNLAVPASSLAINQVKDKQNKKKQNEEKDLKKQQKIASKLDGFELIIKDRVSPGGSLYANIGSDKISIELKKQGFSINKKQITVPLIKEVGEYDCKVKLDHGLEAEVKLTVMAFK